MEAQANVVKMNANGDMLDAEILKKTIHLVRRNFGDVVENLLWVTSPEQSFYWGAQFVEVRVALANEKQVGASTERLFPETMAGIPVKKDWDMEDRTVIFLMSADEKTQFAEIRNLALPKI